MMHTKKDIPFVRVIEILPIDALTPTDGNPRINDQAVDEVAKSISAYGFNQPIAIYGPKNVIKAGHTRWKAAKMLQMKEVPCVRLTHIEAEKIDERERERKLAGYLIADNKTGELAGWDEALLREILIENVGIDIEKLTSFVPTGFSNTELDLLINGYKYEFDLPSAESNRKVQNLKDVTKITLSVSSLEIRNKLLPELRKWLSNLPYSSEVRLHVHDNEDLM